MAWRYTFDGGDEKPLDPASSLYQVAAMAAFAREQIERIPDVREGIHDYDGHVIKLWDTELVDLYPPSLYGLGWNGCGSLQIVTLGKAQ